MSLDTATTAIHILIASMRVLMRAAPPGPWAARRSSGYRNPSIHAADGPLFATGNAHQRTDRQRHAAAAYVVAVNPQSMDIILTLLEQVVAERDALMHAVDRLSVLAAQDVHNEGAHNDND